MISLMILEVLVEEGLSVAADSAKVSANLVAKDSVLSEVAWTKISLAEVLAISVEAIFSQCRACLVAAMDLQRQLRLRLLLKMGGE